MYPRYSGSGLAKINRFPVKYRQVDHKDFVNNLEAPMT
jgi:hypothetical protein